MARPALLLALLLLLGALSPHVVHASTGPEIVGVMANPVAFGDRGEHLMFSFPNGTDLSEYSISDGEGSAQFPDRTVSGPVVASMEPDAVPIEASVLQLEGTMQLANSGETIRLRRGEETVDVVDYDRAIEGQIYRRTSDGWEWRPLGATDRSTVAASNVTVSAFVLPDAPEAPIGHIRNATDRILLGGYTLTSGRVVRTLCGARSRGVTVRVLLEGSPVGGLSSREADRLDRLVDCGVDVSLLGGEYARYSFHHAKYAVLDRGVLVLTENWKPSGTGGRSSRGWGAYVSSSKLANTLAELFRDDVGFRDAIAWEDFRSDMSTSAAEPTPTARFPSSFTPHDANASRVSVLAAPDNAAPAIVSEFDAASESIRIEQISIGSRNHRFVRGLLRAARRGVTVRVLLGSASYVRRENRKIADWLNARARAEGLPLRARLATPRSRFQKIHAKGIVIDGEVAILGSINWTNESIRNNRELALRIRDPTIAEYYRQVFRADWRGGRWTLSVGLLVAAAILLAGATRYALSLAFADDHSVSPDAAIDP